MNSFLNERLFIIGRKTPIEILGFSQDVIRNTFKLIQISVDFPYDTADS